MIVVGTRYYQSTENANGRQQRARDTTLALRDAVPVNLQFTDETFSPEGFRTLPVLRLDSRIVSGGTGARMPIVSEMLDRLAEVAREQGCRYILFHNADIRVTQGAVDLALSRRYEAIAFCRGDLDAATGADAGMMFRGVDAVAVAVDWWTQHRRYFRPYISGPPFWDGVFAGVICSRSRGTIVSDRPLILHEQHPSTWSAADAYAEYNGFLAALDAPYFSRWVRYVAAIEDGLAAGGAVDYEGALAREFSGPLLSPAGRVIHVARQIRARVRYARRRRLARNS